MNKTAAEIANKVTEIMNTIKKNNVLEPKDLGAYSILSYLRSYILETYLAKKKK